MSEAIRAVDDHGRRVQAMFSDIAPGYDRANRIMSLGSDRRWRRRAVEGLLRDEDAAGARVLDLCAGTLDSTREIAHRFERATVVAGDFSAGMLEAGSRALDDELRARVETQQMDAHALPLADRSLDAAFCAFGMRNLSDVPRALAELHRCLRPDARLVVLEFFRPRGAAARTVQALYNHTVLPAVGWACTGNLEAYRYLPRSIDAFDDIPQFSTALDTAGFEVEGVESLALGVVSIVRARRHADRTGGPG